MLLSPSPFSVEKTVTLPSAYFTSPLWNTPNHSCLPGRR